MVTRRLSMIGELRVFSSNPWPLGMGEGWRLGSITNGQGFNKSCLPNKTFIKNNSEWQGLERFWVSEYFKVLGGWPPWREGIEALYTCLLNLPYASLPNIWLLWNSILYNKLVITSKKLFSILGDLVRYQTWRWGAGGKNFWICGQLVKASVTTWDSQLASKVGESLMELSLN